MQNIILYFQIISVVNLQFAYQFVSTDLNRFPYEILFKRMYNSYTQILLNTSLLLSYENRTPLAFYIYASVYSTA